MKKQKLFHLFLAVLVLSLAGCNSTSREEVTLTMWHYYNGAQKLAMDQYVEEFNQTEGLEKGINVEAYSKGSIGQLEEEIIQTIENEPEDFKKPDIITTYSETAYTLDKAGAISNLENYITDKELDKYVDSYVDEGRLGEDGQFKIFPTAKATEVLMLNKTDWDEFSEASGAKLEDLSTWEGLARTAESYYEWTDSLSEGNSGKAFFGRDSLSNYMLVGSKQLGKEIFKLDKDGVELNLDYDNTKRLWDNYYLPYIKGHYTSYGRFSSDDAKVGNIIALVGSTTGAVYFPETVSPADGDSYPIESLTLPLPNFEGSEKMAVQQGAGVIVVKSEEEKERAAVEFLKWFTEEDRNAQFSTMTGYLPVKKSAYEDLEKFKSEFIEKEGLKLGKQLKETIPLAMEQMQEYQPYFSTAFDGALNVREILKIELDKKSKEDREKVEELINQGLAYEDAVGKFAGEENFNSWYLQIEDRLKKVVNYEE